MGSAPAHLHGVNLHKVQRNGSIIKVTMFDGGSFHGQLVSFNDWHMLIQREDVPCVVIMRAVTSIEEI